MGQLLLSVSVMLFADADDEKARTLRYAGKFRMVLKYGAFAG